MTRIGIIVSCHQGCHQVLIVQYASRQTGRDHVGRCTASTAPTSTSVAASRYNALVGVKAKASKSKQFGQKSMIVQKTLFDRSFPVIGNAGTGPKDKMIFAAARRLLLPGMIGRSDQLGIFLFFFARGKLVPGEPFKTAHKQTNAGKKEGLLGASQNAQHCHDGKEELLCCYY